MTDTAPPALPPLPTGFRAAGMHCGIKRSGKHDLGLLVAEEATPAACVFTRNLLNGAHVVLGRESLARSGGRVRAVLVNSGNANCATGPEGLEDARRIAARLAVMLGCPPEQVLFFSTGVIGARLPADRIEAALPDLVGAAGEDGLGDFARAILTTDTGVKLAGRAAPRVTGVAKGSGMVHPDMATMLAYVLTDAPLASGTAQLLRRATDRSFHRLTVDGDTSPNDAVLLWSSGAAGAAHPRALEDAVTSVSAELARAIAADGEGATRLVTIHVTGAPSEEVAAAVGRTVATSLLVKTAVHGRDPNWGRILSAAARAGIELDAGRVRIGIGEADVFSGGRPHPENEGAASRHMQESAEVRIDVDLALGDAGADVWTCDLSADYVRINADYRT